MKTTDATAGSQDALVRRVCATCATWNPALMECRGVPGEAAPPDAGCEGWVKTHRRDHWAKRCGQSPNTTGSGTPGGCAMNPPKTQPALSASPGSAFLRDVVEARRMWGERDSWQRDESGECKADRVWLGLVWSAAHEGMMLGGGPGGEWSEMKQNALNAARLEYEMRSRMALFTPNTTGSGTPGGEQ